MAAALLRSQLPAGTWSVLSAGVAAVEGREPPPEVVKAIGSFGIDLSLHRSRRMSRDDLLEADLVLAMAREHVRHCVVLEPSCWARTFTLKELVRRTDGAGEGAPGGTFAPWLENLAQQREYSELLGDDNEDDVADPIGLPPEYYERTASELDSLVTRLAAAIGPLASLGWAAS